MSAPARVVPLSLGCLLLLGPLISARPARGQEAPRRKSVLDLAQEDISNFGKPETPRGTTAIIWNTRYVLYGDPTLDVVHGAGGVVIGLKSRLTVPNGAADYEPDRTGRFDFKEPPPLVLEDRSTHKAVLALSATVLTQPFTIASCALGPDGTFYVAEEEDNGKTIAVTAFNPPGLAAAARNPVEQFTPPPTEPRTLKTLDDPLFKKCVTAFQRVINSPLTAHMTDRQRQLADAIQRKDIEPNPNEPEVVSGIVKSYISSFRALLLALIGNSTETQSLYSVPTWRTVALPQDILAQKEVVRKLAPTGPQTAQETLKLNRMLVMFVVGDSENGVRWTKRIPSRTLVTNARLDKGRCIPLKADAQGVSVLIGGADSGIAERRFRLREDGTLERIFPDHPDAREGANVYHAFWPRWIRLDNPAEPQSRVQAVGESTRPTGVSGSPPQSVAPIKDFHIEREFCKPMVETLLRNNPRMTDQEIKASSLLKPYRYPEYADMLDAVIKEVREARKEQSKP